MSRGTSGVRKNSAAMFFRWRRERFLFLALTFFFGSLILMGLQDPEYTSRDEYRSSVYKEKELLSSKMSQESRDPSKPVVYLGTVICSFRLEEGMTMLKSVLLFSRFANLYLVVITDRENRRSLTDKLEELYMTAKHMGIHLDYELHMVYIHSKNRRKWHIMFAPCSPQRLFFPLSLPHIEHLMYVDTDVLFLSDILNLWNQFSHFKANTLAAAAAEHELPGDGWYNQESLIPYYGPRGINTGILLMNLTAMRLLDFTNRVERISEDYARTIEWADQDMLNILFNKTPGQFYEIGCEFNYRVQHCFCDYPGTGDCGCKNAERNGISVFHGNRQRFHKSQFLINIYKAFKEVDLVKTSLRDLLQSMKRTYKDLPQDAICNDIPTALFTKMEQYCERI